MLAYRTGSKQLRNLCYLKVGAGPRDRLRRNVDPINWDMTPGGREDTWQRRKPKAVRYFQESSVREAYSFKILALQLGESTRLVALGGTVTSWVV